MNDFTDIEIIDIEGFGAVGALTLWTNCKTITLVATDGDTEFEKTLAAQIISLCNIMGVEDSDEDAREEHLAAANAALENMDCILAEVKKQLAA
jgi:hypothetical protein